MIFRTVCIVVSSLILSACCTGPKRVLFVTDSTIGIDVDTKPPTASVAYSRIEGYIGPRYENGAVPPVVASIQTGGTVFSPHIRQVYATGVAAVKAVDTANVPDGNYELSGSGKGEMLFFGTTTTLGFKLGFSPSGAPDSMTLGYKRKEFSYVPLGTKAINGKQVDAYPSVLASIDTTVKSQELRQAGLDSVQFFATGQAAERLATTKAVSSAFKGIAAEALTSALTDDQMRAALKAGAAASVEQDAQLNKVLTYVAPHGALNRDRLSALVDAANHAVPDSVPTDLKKMKDAAQVRTYIGDNQQAVESLSRVLPISH